MYDYIIYIYIIILR